MPCVVLNRSDGGFKLHVHAPEQVPSRFELRLDSEQDKTYDCEVVWREGNAIGVKLV